MNTPTNAPRLPSPAEVAADTKRNVGPTPAEVKSAATGRWNAIFEDLAPSLQAAIAYAPYHVTCPHHGGDDGFRLFEHYNDTGRSVCNTCGVQSSGIDTLMLANGWTFPDAIRKVGDWLKLEAQRPAKTSRPPPPMRPRVDPAVAYRRLKEVWQASTPIAGSPAEKYLAARGIWPENIPVGLRAHPGLPYVHGKERTFYGKFPCLLAPIRNLDNALVSIHRIFLTPEGKKAPVPDPKKMMSQYLELSGSAIQLFKPTGDTLGLAEGIETALAAHAISRMPTWACVSAVLMEQVEVPKYIKKVVIWGDLDASNRGIEASTVLAERLEAKGIQVQVYLPNCPIPEGEKGVDWLDVLLSQGVNGFPAQWRRWRPAQ